MEISGSSKDRAVCRQASRANNRFGRKRYDEISVNINSVTITDGQVSQERVDDDHEK